MIVVGALADQRGVRRLGVAELALQPLGRQLDRGQRVLDLVRQPARHLAPRRHLLGADERRDVVEDDHRALEAAGAVEPRRRHRQGHLAAVAGQRQLLRHRLAPGAGGVVDQRGHRRERAQHLRHRPPLDPGAEAEQARGGGVDPADRPVGVDRHHPGGNPLQDRLDRAVPALDLVVALLELDRWPARAIAAAPTGRRPWR